MRRTIFMLFAIPLMLAGTLTSGPASAHFVPAPCDFITGGGFIFGNSGQFINFGAHGGCKHGQFWGHVNVLDHSFNPPAHLRSTNITGYLMDPAFPNARDICGEGVVDGGAGSFTVTFRVRMEDNGEPGVGVDRFGVRLSNGYLQSTRIISGGNIQLHKQNPSTTGPSPAPTEAQMCGGLATPDQAF
ncbi:MAG: hypothetical protein E6H56_06850 [Betaproteobacteria bacterium]|nr:MAG: hypothetical protein E6H56_06850 [Betaproteobacteria bacterium]